MTTNAKWINRTNRCSYRLYQGPRLISTGLSKRLPKNYKALQITHEVMAYPGSDDDLRVIVLKYLPPTKPHLGWPRCDPAGHSTASYKSRLSAAAETRGRLFGSDLILYKKHSATNRSSTELRHLRWFFNAKSDMNTHSGDRSTQHVAS